MRTARFIPARQQRGGTLKIGFVPLNDCAPIVAAHELGFFARHGLKVSLHRELGWATVRDKIIYRELDAAHALAAMPLAATLGLGSIRCDCLTGIVLNLNGNAITLAQALWKKGVRDGTTLRQEISRVRHERTMTFGVVNRFSSHRHLLRKWFRTHGIDADRDVRIVVLPPSQMNANLAMGNIDGFCVGEPWSSVAISSGTGWCAATSADIEPGHPEKVLMVRADLAERQEKEHLTLVAAIHDACRFCDSAENLPELAAILARPEYVGAPAKLIEAGLQGRLPIAHGETGATPGFCIFHHDSANEPSPARAAWTMELIRGSGALLESAALAPDTARQVFRFDIYERATQTISQISKNNPYEEQHQLTAA